MVAERWDCTAQVTQRFEPARSTKSETTTGPFTPGREKTARRGSWWRWAPPVTVESTANRQQAHVLVVACAPLVAVAHSPTMKKKVREFARQKSLGRASGRCGRRAVGLRSPGDAAICAVAQHEIGDDRRPVYAGSREKCEARVVVAVGAASPRGKHGKTSAGPRACRCMGSARGRRARPHEKEKCASLPDKIIRPSERSLWSQSGQIAQPW